MILAWSPGTPNGQPVEAAVTKLRGEIEVTIACGGRVDSFRAVAKKGSSKMPTTTAAMSKLPSPQGRGYHAVYRESEVNHCPGCGRTTSTFFQEMAEDILGYIREKMPEWRTLYPGVEPLDVAVMGCVVNGPGESRHAARGRL